MIESLLFYNIEFESHCNYLIITEIVIIKCNNVDNIWLASKYIGNIWNKKKQVCLAKGEG